MHPGAAWTIAPVSVDHYENFPVASWLCPPALRAPIAAIYWFARTADDLADEGDASAAQRLADLGSYRADLAAVLAGQAASSRWPQVFEPLARAIRQHALPAQPLHDLLDAFAQDVVKQRYATYAELLDYCRRSANPVGRLLLHLVGRTAPEHLQRSDAICSALQLANFWQDIAIDWRKDRVYLPQEDLARFGVDEAQIAAGTCNASWQALLEFETGRTRDLMCAGAPLVHALPGRMGWEIRFTVQGGLRILERTRQVAGDVFRRRPALGPADWLLIAGRTVIM